MRPKSAILLSLAIAAILATRSSANDWRSVGNVTTVSPLPNGVELRAGRAAVRITALAPSVIRVRYARDGHFAPDQSFAVVQNTGFQAPSVEAKDSPDRVEFTTAELKIRIDKRPLRITFADLSDNVILSDARPAEWNGQSFRVRKNMASDEHYYGLGDKASSLDHRGKRFTLWNTSAYAFKPGTDPLYKSIPFFLAKRGPASYGLFLDNTFRSTFDFGKETRNVLSFGAEGGELNYYFFYGPDPKTVIANYTALTGRTPLPPLWALGYQQSRWSYYPESRVREIANEFRRRHIPADVIWLDIDYQDGFAPFTVDRLRFPHFEQMIHDLSDQGFKVVAITDPQIEKKPGYAPYDDGLAHNCFVRNPDGSPFIGRAWPGDCAFPDFANSATRKWWGELYKPFVDDGIRGFWNDMNEPEIFKSPNGTIPLNALHRLDDRVTTHNEFHNVYGMENARATYEGLRKLQPDLRPFVMTRAAFAGTQRYAATWTGDNVSQWRHLKLSIPMLLSLGISGFALSGDDIGGFLGIPAPDLLTRWTEVGAFTPLFRNHTAKGMPDKEPWVNGPEHEAIRRRFIEARYKLLPYLYTAMEESSRTGVPLMRPLFLEFPNEPDLDTIDTEYMLGASLLVAPKLTDSQSRYTIALPRGKWYNYWTGAILPDVRSFSVNPALNELPVFVRGGSIIPRQPLVQHVEVHPKGPLELRVYPGPGCDGSLYLDDGETFAYTHGSYLRQRYSCVSQPGSVELEIAAPEGKFTPWWKEIECVIAGAPNAPLSVTSNGKPLSSSAYDKPTHSVRFIVPATPSETRILVRYE